MALRSLKLYIGAPELAGGIAEKGINAASEVLPSRSFAHNPDKWGRKSAQPQSCKVARPKAITMIKGSLIVHLLLVGFNITNAAGTGGDTKIH